MTTTTKTEFNSINGFIPRDTPARVIDALEDGYWNLFHATVGNNQLISKLEFPTPRLLFKELYRRRHLPGTNNIHPYWEMRGVAYPAPRLNLELDIDEQLGAYDAYGEWADKIVP
jgi:hypothetical protein